MNPLWLTNPDQARREYLQQKASDRHNARQARLAGSGVAICLMAIIAIPMLPVLIPVAICAAAVYLLRKKKKANDR
jgi:uncharacterized protein involved in cysteine biosynthesis